MNTDLLTQLTAVIATAETNRIDAERWHFLIDLLGDLGYGTRFTPALIAALVPNVNDINEILAATQEVVAAPDGSKFPRRKLTAEDKREIRARSEDGTHPEQIAVDLGISLKSVIAFLNRD